jgi:hypothetical protein
MLWTCLGGGYWGSGGGRRSKRMLMVMRCGGIRIISNPFEPAFLDGFVSDKALSRVPAFQVRLRVEGDIAAAHFAAEQLRVRHGEANQVLAKP